MLPAVPETCRDPPSPPQFVWWWRAAETEDFFLKSILYFFSHVKAEAVFLPINKNAVSCFPVVQLIPPPVRGPWWCCWGIWWRWVYPEWRHGCAQVKSLGLRQQPWSDPAVTFGRWDTKACQLLSQLDKCAVRWPPHRPLNWTGQGLTPSRTV